MATYDPNAKITAVVTTNPADSDDASELAAASRETRSVMSRILSYLLDDSGASPIFNSGVVNGAGLADTSVTEGKIADNAVTASKIGPEAVGDTELAQDASVDANRAVSTNSIKDLAVTTGKIANDAVDTDKLADNAVETDRIKDKNVTGPKIANDASVDANRAIGSDHIKDEAVIARHLAAGALPISKLSETAPGVDKLVVLKSDGSYELCTTSGLSIAESSGVLTFTHDAASQLTQLPFLVMREYITAAQTLTGLTASSWNAINRLTATLTFNAEVVSNINSYTVDTANGIKFSLPLGVYLIRGKFNTGQPYNTGSATLQPVMHRIDLMENPTTPALVAYGIPQMSGIKEYSGSGENETGVNYHFETFLQVTDATTIYFFRQQWYPPASMTALHFRIPVAYTTGPNQYETGIFQAIKL